MTLFERKKMPLSKNKLAMAYGVGESLIPVFPVPFVSNRDPGNNDVALIGTLWINQVTFDSFILAGFNAGVPQWIGAGGGGGLFANLTVNPGPTNLTGAVNITGLTTMIGNLDVTGNVDITGDLNLDTGDASIVADTIVLEATAAAAPAILIEASNAAGSVDIRAGSNGILIGNEADTAVIRIADIVPITARTVTVDSGTVATAIVDTLNLGTGGVAAIAGATRTINIGTGPTTLGTQTINIGTGPFFSGLASINISTGGGPKSVFVGGIDALSTIDINGSVFINDSSIGDTLINAGAGTGNVDIGNAAAGAITIQTANSITLGAEDGVLVQGGTDTQAIDTATINNYQGIATFTGFTTAVASTQVFVINNALVTATDGIIVTASNKGTNPPAPNPQMAVVRVIPALGSFTVIVGNLGTAALDGDLILSFWVLR